MAKADGGDWESHRRRGFLTGSRGGPPESALPAYLLHVRLERRDHAAFTGKWYLKQIYDYGYFPVYGFIVLLGATGILPRVRRSTKGEGIERRYFYGSVWAVTLSQTMLLVLWKALPRDHTSDVIKLVVYGAALVAMGACAAMGLLPRTRPIIPGELMVGD